MKRDHLHQKKWALLLMLFISISVFAQRDNDFWFALPTISQKIDGSPPQINLPDSLRITAFDYTAHVVLSIPSTVGGAFNTTFGAANPITVPPRTTVSIGLTPYLSGLESRPPDVVTSTGLHITSDQGISVYYELANYLNGNFWPLKGKNAVGTSFYIPGQTFMPNHWTDTTFNTINIVATTTGDPITHLTTVSITPSNSVRRNGGGVHAAGTLYTVTLLQGQAYTAQDQSTLANMKLAGSIVTSDYPIAITESDDYMATEQCNGCGGGYWDNGIAAHDAGGDQLIPLNKIGTEYIAVRGGLTVNPEKLFVLTTVPNTTINQDGAFVTTVATAGTTVQLNLLQTSVSSYINTNQPVYVSQISGMKSEPGWNILPPITTCSGSTSVAYYRTFANSDNGVLMLLATNGGQNSFHYYINGVLQAGPLPVTPVWTAVPGAPAGWVATQINVSAGVNFGDAILVTNSTPFTMGVVTGAHSAGSLTQNATGLFGYFSSFGGLNISPVASTSCPGDTLYLSADSLIGGIYSWRGPGGFTSGAQDTFIYPFTVADTGLYYLTVTSGSLSCTSYDSVYVGFGPNCCTALSLGNDTSYCTNFTRTLSINIAGASYRWSTGATTDSITVSGPGLYWGQDSTHCGIMRDTIILTRNFPPVVNLGNDTTLCVGASLVLNDTSTNTTFLWSTNATTSSINVTNSGTYWLQVTQRNCPASDTIVVTFISPSSPFSLGNDTAYCTNFTRTLSISIPNVHYRWSTGATSSSITVSAPGLYWGQDSSLCGVRRDSILLTQNAPPVVNLGNDTTLCVGATLILNDTSTNATFLWSTNATTSSINVTTSGTYWLQVTQQNCPARDTIVATFLSPSSSFNLGNDTVYCTNFTRTLSISIPNVHYRWNTGATTSSITVSAPGLYWGQDSSLCGVKRDSIILTQNTPPIVNLGNDTILCVGASLILNDTSTNATFLWSTNATTSSINVTTSGTYWLQVTQQNCPARDTMVATFISPPAAFNLGNDTAYCTSFTRSLSIGIANVGYSWSTGVTTSSIIVNTPGLFWGQDSNMCGVKRDTIVLTQNAPPIVNLGNDTTLCVGASLILNDTSTNATFLWSTTATTSSINVTTSGTYWLQVTQQNCPARDTIIATFLSPPSAFNIGNDTAYCTNFTRNLSIGVAYVSYRWSTGATASSIIASAPGLYWGQDSNLCGVSRDTIILTQNAPPVVNLGNDTTLCIGASLILNDTSTNATFLWSTTATTSSISVDTSGTYWLQVTQNNCPGIDTIIATFLSPPPAFSLGNKDTAYCGNFSRILTTGGASARWSTGADTSTITVSAPGVYWAEVSNICGMSTDTVRLYQNPIPVVTLGPDTTICADSSYSIPGVSSAPSVVWTPATGLDSPNIVNPTFRYSDSVNFTIIATFPSTGCADTAYLNIGVDNCTSYIDGPQAFSPNGDGTNDHYTLFANKIAEYDLRIYNRWGEMVFEDTNLADLNDVSKGWDGTYKGKPQEVSVFVYYIIATDDYHKKISKKGNITLLR
jgi:gliding motility-associated-like protein